MRFEPSLNRHQLSLRPSALNQDASYQAVYGDVSKVIDAARESVARSVSAAMTAVYWLIGHRIIEFKQSGKERAEYRAALIEWSGLSPGTPGTPHTGGKSMTRAILQAEWVGYNGVKNGVGEIVSPRCVGCFDFKR